MSNPHWLWPAAVAAVAGLLLGLTLGRGRPVDPVVLHRVDSVLVEGPGVRDSLRALARAAAIAEREALAFHGEAARLRRVADSLKAAAGTVQGPVAAPMETVTMVPAAAFDTLAAAYTALDLAYQSAIRSNQTLRAEVSIAETRIQTLEATLRTAQAEIKRTRRPGRLSLGCSAGYGAVSAAGVVATGPGAVCGVSYRLWPN